MINIFFILVGIIILVFGSFGLIHFANSGDGVSLLVGLLIMAVGIISIILPTFNIAKNNTVDKIMNRHIKYELVRIDCLGIRFYKEVEQGEKNE